MTGSLLLLSSTAIQDNRNVVDEYGLSKSSPIGWRTAHGRHLHSSSLTASQFLVPARPQPSTQQVLSGFEHMLSSDRTAVALYTPTAPLALDYVFKTSGQVLVAASSPTSTVVLLLSPGTMSAQLLWSFEPSARFIVLAGHLFSDTLPNQLSANGTAVTLTTPSPNDTTIVTLCRYDRASAALVTSAPQAAASVHLPVSLTPACACSLHLHLSNCQGL